MKEINENEYCLVCLENTSGMRDKVLAISINPHKYIEGDNMLITIFKTYLTPLEMKEYFEPTNEKTFFIFETSKSSMSISDKRIEDYLINNIDELVINSENNIPSLDLNSMSRDEIDNLVDELIDKGSGLTEEDKKVLNFLINKIN